MCVRVMCKATREDEQQVPGGDTAYTISLGPIASAVISTANEEDSGVWDI